MFKITQGRGFHITFENGYTVSVQFGIGNYCDNRTYDWMDEGWVEQERAAGERGCSTAEVACWNHFDEWLPLGPSDSVVGWVTADEVAQLIRLVSQLPRAEERGNPLMVFGKLGKIFHGRQTDG